ncbi:thyrotroph embryonic factor isoform X3 [Diachasma alloeum]|uniref:thyrotroph embryonic factor isoform X3 n=1 Tax=Diachasma alloeum TaxID=454923 RepID=UPI0007382468|nr:thyrotroph embryonic factor isoform X3 [Diachasma alloeum]
MSETEAGASWQQHYVWGMNYPHHQYNLHQQSQYQLPYHHHHPHNHQSSSLNGNQSYLSTSGEQSMSIQSSQDTSPHHQQHQQSQSHYQRLSNTIRRQSIPYDASAGDPMITSSLKGKQTKDGPEEKKDADGELWGNVEAQAAFLGPNIWDKTLPYDADLKVLNHYVDLDEFLSENGIPVDGVGGGGQGTMQGSQLHKMSNSSNEATSHQGPAGLHLEPVTKRERSASPSDCCSPDTLNPPSPADSNSGDSSRIQYGLSLVALSMASSGRDFDPRTRAFSDEELKPQPMIKKSRKQDDKYWARRRKNNMAAKRSRDARRMKENQIALRAGFLEKENMGLRQELDRLKNENMLLRDKLSKYTDG